MDHRPRERSRAATRAGRFALVALLAIAALLALPTSPATASAEQAADAACPAAATPNGRYVTFLYEEILLRCPDPGAAAYWTARLDRGDARWTVAEAIDTSTENLGRNNVEVLYRILLERAPTTAERSSWIGYLRTAHENAVPTATLLASQEGYDLHTSSATASGRDREWLAWAYNRILDRAPDPAGEAHYLRKLGPGSTQATRLAVAMSLERSPSNAGSWVRGAMSGALGRSPDPSGVRHWTAWLVGPGRWQTFRLWTHLLSSDEAFRRSQLV